MGNFNLSINGHAECVRFVSSYNLPTLVLGGGGYSIRNVSRCWTNETAVLLDVDLPNDLPNNDYFAHFAPDYKLQNTGIEMENLNTRSYLDTLLTQVRKNIRTLQHAPSVQMKAIPPSLFDTMMEMVDEDAEDKDANEDYLKETARDESYDRSPIKHNPTAEFTSDINKMDDDNKASHEAGAMASSAGDAGASSSSAPSHPSSDLPSSAGGPSSPHSSSPSSSPSSDSLSTRREHSNARDASSSAMAVDDDDDVDPSKGCF